MATDVSQVIGELGAGQFESQLSHVLSDVAGAVLDHETSGKVVITLNIKKIKNSSQVNVDHTLSFKRPTAHGSKSEDFTSSTPMYVGAKGAISYFPEKQGRMFDIKGNAED